MKHLAFLLCLCFLALAGFHAPKMLHGDVPSSASMSPAKPRHWTITIPQWHPVTESQWERMSGGERFASEQEARRAVERAATTDDGSCVVPGDAGRLAMDVVMILAPRQHRPTAEGIWPAVLRALEAGAAIRGERGDMRFVRSGSKGEYGVEVNVREAR